MTESHEEQHCFEQPSRTAEPREATAVPGTAPDPPDARSGSSRAVPTTAPDLYGERIETLRVFAAEEKIEVNERSSATLDTSWIMWSPAKMLNWP